LAFIPVLLSGGNRGAPQLGQPGQVPHELSTQAMAYEYDQLNRLTQAAAFDQFADNAWQATNSIPNKYRNEFSYDANGNIATQSRYNGQGNLIDSLVYFYESENGKKTNNRLYHYHDLSSDTTALELEQTNIPFDSAAPNSVLSSNFFRYDELGNLVADLSNDIHRIDWRADGKVRSVHKTDSSHLSFDYDGLGNRIAKHQHRYDTLIKSTYYSRDAQGNVMAIYEKTLDHNNSTLSHQIKERYIYGSNRVGTFIEEAEMIGSSTTNTTFSHHLGARNYELVNHLGNVLAVVSDAPIKVDTNNDHLRDYNLPTLLSSQDYYPFGSLMRERSFGGYRYGFNGMEKDDEVKGSGNSYTTEFRQYDPRLGRWLSIDPLFRSFPWQSPYVAFDNNPIRKVDPRGDAAGDPEKLKLAAKAGAEASKNYKNEENVSSACNIAVKCGVKNYTGENLLFGRANDIAQSLAAGNVKGFQELEIGGDYSKLQDLANQGVLIVGATDKSALDRSGHVVIFVPGEMAQGNSWKGGGPMPQVMDGGFKGDFEKTPLTTVSGKGTVEAMRFYVYKPSLELTNSVNIKSKINDLPKPSAESLQKAWEPIRTYLEMKESAKLPFPDLPLKRSTINFNNENQEIEF
jgi:RHS repeat-associated protein